MAEESNKVPLTLRDFFFQDPFFKSSWEDFDRIRQDMLKESQDFWSKMCVEDKDAATAQLTPMGLPRKWMLPRLLSRDETNQMFPADFFHGFKREEDHVLKVTDDNGKFELSLDTHEYRPDELKINITGDALTVEAKHEEKGDDRFVSRQFKRSYTLPKGCEADKVTSNLSSDGILMITAPKKPAIKQDDGNRAIQIDMKK